MAKDILFTFRICNSFIFFWQRQIFCCCTCIKLQTFSCGKTNIDKLMIVITSAFLRICFCLVGKIWFSWSTTPKEERLTFVPLFFGKVKQTKSSPSLARWWATLTSREYLIEHFAKVHYYQQKLNEPESRGGFFRLQGNPNSSFHSGDFGENSWLIQYHLFGKYVIFFKQFDEEKVFGKFKVIQEVGIKTQPDIQIVSEWFENLHNLKRSFR